MVDSNAHPREGARDVFKTEQERFWAGEFGTEYTKRNSDPKALGSNLALFTKALHKTRRIADCIEFGANIGLNLRALQLLFPEQLQYAIEINFAAATELAKVIPAENIFHSSILNFESKRTFDLVLIKGVLIHINPDELPQVYQTLHRATGRYLFVCEYYNPHPVQIDYRGHRDRLYKRDFCGEILDAYPDLQLIDYGFVYHRDANFPQDDITWFLMEKRA
jgi:pseudaminic acid biosynthesis-associated methylase